MSSPPQEGNGGSGRECEPVGYLPTPGLREEVPSSLQSREAGTVAPTLAHGGMRPARSSGPDTVQWPCPNFAIQGICHCCVTNTPSNKITSEL